MAQRRCCPRPTRASRRVVSPASEEGCRLVTDEPSLCRSCDATLGEHHRARGRREVGAQPEARLPVHPLVARAGRPGEQDVRRRLGRRDGLDVLQQDPAEPAALQVGATMTRPMSQLWSPSSRPRTAPTRRPARRTTQVSHSRSQARTSSRDSCSAGMSSMSLASASCTQQARCSVSSSPASPGVARTMGVPSSSTDGVSRSGRRSAVRRTACSWRQAATRAWSPERSTAGTSWPRHSGGLV